MKPCRRCGSTLRYKNGSCKQCAREQQKRYYSTIKDDPEFLRRNREGARVWAARHPQECAKKAAARRARCRAQLGSLDAHSKLEAIYLAAAWLRDQGIDVHVDHINPLIQGGAHSWENLQIVPAPYNLSKGAR